MSHSRVGLPRYSEVQRLERARRRHRHHRLAAAENDQSPTPPQATCDEGGGGGANNPSQQQPQQQQRPRPAQRRQQVVTRTLIPTGLDIFPWATTFINEARFALTRYAIWAFVAIFVILIFWIARWVPGTTTAVWRYGAFSFFVLFPFYLLNALIALYSTVTEFYVVGAFLFLFAYALQVYLVVVLFVNFYNCFLGTFPPSCTGNLVVDTFVSIPAVILVVVGFFTCLEYLFIIARTSNTNTPVVIERTRA
jgi:hypothetical protein